MADRRLGQVVAVAGVAIVTFWLLRNHVADRYTVDSGSMEPTLVGHPDRGGDVVLVDKTAWWFGRRPARHDLVVVRNRDDARGDHVVKRLVSRTDGEYLQLLHGELYAGPTAQGLELVVKAPERAAAAGQLVTHAHYDATGETPGAVAVETVLETADERWTRRNDGTVRLHGVAAWPAPDLRDRAHATTVDAVDTSFVTRDGRRLAGGRGFPRDVGLEVVVRGGTLEGLQFVLEHLGVQCALRLPFGREAVPALRVDGRVVPLADCDGPRSVGDGAWRRVTFGYLDGHVFALVDGARVAYGRVELPFQARQVRVPGGGPRRPANVLGLAAVGGDADLREVRTFHDVFYRPEPMVDAYHVETGELFLLGDNSFGSADSRNRPADPYAVTDLIGRPLLVLAPRGRVRWLAP